MKVLIIEDEAPAAGRLKQLLRQIDERIEVLATIESVEDAVNYLSSSPSPDLIFMDIQLEDGICFEIFDTVRVDVPVIFTTAYDQYALRAFKVNSVDYLLKPIDTGALRAALDKYRSVFRPEGAGPEQVEDWYKPLIGKFKTRFFVRSGAHFRSVPIADIACFFIEERCAFLSTRDGRRYDVDASLEQVLDMVDPTAFFRINRTHIIQLDSIADIISYSANRLKVRLAMPGGEELVVSRDRVRDFKDWLDR